MQAVPAAFSRTAIFHAPRDERRARTRIYAANCFSLLSFANIQPERNVSVRVRSIREIHATIGRKDEYDKNLIAPKDR